MAIFQPGSGVKFRATLIFLAVFVLLLGPALAEETPEEWQPSVPMPDKFDWIQLKSDEWLKGEIISMYEEVLEFDSDELDDLTLDWEDVKQIRSARIMQVRFLGNVIAIGKLHIEGDKVRVIGEQDQEFERSQVLTITAGEPKESNYWKGKFSIGISVQQGNVDQVDVNSKANFKRRTVKNRIILDYIANYGRVEDQDTADNQRVSITWDRFITDRFFTKPVALEYYRDPFQNIGSRTTLTIGAGYQLIDTKKTDWQVSGGPGYQQTQFDDVVAGEDDSEETPALTVGTIFDTELTRTVDFIYEYRFQLTSEAAGSYNHHMVMTVETEWTKHLDFDVSLVWDRTQDPRQNSDGSFPEQDDYRAIISLGWDF